MKLFSKKALSLFLTVGFACVTPTQAHAHLFSTIGTWITNFINADVLQHQDQADKKRELSKRQRNRESFAQTEFAKSESQENNSSWGWSSLNPFNWHIKQAVINFWNAGVVPQEQYQKSRTDYTTLLDGLSDDDEFFSDEDSSEEEIIIPSDLKHAFDAGKIKPFKKLLKGYDGNKAEICKLLLRQILKVDSSEKSKRIWDGEKDTYKAWVGFFIKQKGVDLRGVYSLAVENDNENLLETGTITSGFTLRPEFAKQKKAHNDWVSLGKKNNEDEESNFTGAVVLTDLDSLSKDKKRKKEKVKDLTKAKILEKLRVCQHTGDLARLKSLYKKYNKIVSDYLQEKDLLKAFAKNKNIDLRYKPWIEFLAEEHFVREGAYALAMQNPAAKKMFEECEFLAQEKQEFEQEIKEKTRKKEQREHENRLALERAEREKRRALIQKKEADRQKEQEEKEELAKRRAETGERDEQERKKKELKGGHIKAELLTIIMNAPVPVESESLYKKDYLIDARAKIEKLKQQNEQAFEGLKSNPEILLAANSRKMFHYLVTNGFTIGGCVQKAQEELAVALKKEFSATEWGPWLESLEPEILFTIALKNNLFTHFAKNNNGLGLAVLCKCFKDKNNCDSIQAERLIAFFKENSVRDELCGTVDVLNGRENVGNVSTNSLYEDIKSVAFMCDGGKESPVHAKLTELGFESSMEKFYEAQKKRNKLPSLTEQFSSCVQGGVVDVKKLQDLLGGLHEKETLQQAIKESGIWDAVVTAEKLVYAGSPNLELNILRKFAVVKLSEKSKVTENVIYKAVEFGTQSCFDNSDRSVKKIVAKVKKEALEELSGLKPEGNNVLYYGAKTGFNGDPEPNWDALNSADDDRAKKGKEKKSVLNRDDDIDSFKLDIEEGDKQLARINAAIAAKTGNSFIRGKKDELEDEDDLEEQIASDEQKIKKLEKEILLLKKREDASTKDSEEEGDGDVVILDGKRYAVASLDELGADSAVQLLQEVIKVKPQFKIVENESKEQAQKRRAAAADWQKTFNFVFSKLELSNSSDESKGQLLQALVDTKPKLDADQTIWSNVVRKILITPGFGKQCKKLCPSECEQLVKDIPALGMILGMDKALVKGVSKNSITGNRGLGGRKHLLCEERRSLVEAEKDRLEKMKAEQKELQKKTIAEMLKDAIDADDYNTLSACIKEMVKASSDEVVEDLLCDTSILENGKSLVDYAEAKYGTESDVVRLLNIAAAYDVDIVEDEGSKELLSVDEVRALLKTAIDKDNSSSIVDLTMCSYSDDFKQELLYGVSAGLSGSIVDYAKQKSNSAATALETACSIYPKKKKEVNPSCKDAKEEYEENEGPDDDFGSNSDLGKSGNQGSSFVVLGQGDSGKTQTSSDGSSKSSGSDSKQQDSVQAFIAEDEGDGNSLMESAIGGGFTHTFGDLKEEENKESKKQVKSILKKKTKYPTPEELADTGDALRYTHPQQTASEIAQDERVEKEKKKVKFAATIDKVGYKRMPAERERITRFNINNPNGLEVMEKPGDDPNDNMSDEWDKDLSTIVVDPDKKIELDDNLLVLNAVGRDDASAAAAQIETLVEDSEALFEAKEQAILQKYYDKLNEKIRANDSDGFKAVIGTEVQNLQKDIIHLYKSKKSYSWKGKYERALAADAKKGLGPAIRGKSFFGKWIVNYQDNGGNTLLHHAAKIKEEATSLKFLDTLVALGARADAQNYTEVTTEDDEARGQTPADVATTDTVKKVLNEVSAAQEKAARDYMESLIPHVQQKHYTTKAKQERELQIERDEYRKASEMAVKAAALKREKEKETERLKKLDIDSFLGEDHKNAQTVLKIIKAQDLQKEKLEQTIDDDFCSLGYYAIAVWHDVKLVKELLKRGVDFTEKYGYNGGMSAIHRWAGQTNLKHSTYKANLSGKAKKEYLDSTDKSVTRTRDTAKKALEDYYTIAKLLQEQEQEQVKVQWEEAAKKVGLSGWLEDPSLEVFGITDSIEDFEVIEMDTEEKKELDSSSVDIPVWLTGEKEADFTDDEQSENPLLLSHVNSTGPNKMVAKAAVAKKPSAKEILKLKGLKNKVVGAVSQGNFKQLEDNIKGLSAGSMLQLLEMPAGDAKAKSKETILEVALKKANPEIVEALLRHGVPAGHNKSKLLKIVGKSPKAKKKKRGKRSGSGSVSLQDKKKVKDLLEGAFEGSKELDRKKKSL